MSLELLLSEIVIRDDALIVLLVIPMYETSSVAPAGTLRVKLPSTSVTVPVFF